ncbi:hypothetical protein SLS55_010520 [Diplodia seriata]|uniref:Large ribosomal subunit protein mL67 n=1 Tax=Diplodia seriata TaxID=420778 RepID=A0A1S8BKA9_9PEZI|nr:hypothetical protein BK809_0008005 [Diplodia seriata]
MELTKAAQAARLAKKAFFAQKATEQGRHIFIYNNIRTNQTVCSLERSLNNHDALSQLAYAGKKTIPAALRKDVWRPMAIVTFPSPAQGRSVYQKLREFRKLHELHWDNNQEYPMLPPETQKRIKEGKAAPTKKERAKIIMDQKANTIADLAALLKTHDEGGSVEKLRAEVQALEAAQKSRLAEIEQEMAAKKLEMDDPKLNGSTRKPFLVVYKSLKREKELLLKGEEREALLKRLNEKESHLESLKREREKLLSAEAVPKALAKDVELANKAENGGLSRLAEEITEANKFLATELLTPRLRRRWESRVEEAQREQKEMWRAIESVGEEMARRMAKSGSKAPPPKPRWGLNGVSIRWADVLDADYAGEWPAQVVHDRLGLVKHSAPDPKRAAPGLSITNAELERRLKEEEEAMEAEMEAAEGEAAEGEAAEGKAAEEGKPAEEGKKVVV